MALTVIGGLASISQLIAYSHSASRCLQQLLIGVRDGPTSYKSEKTNIMILLEVIGRVCKQDVVGSEEVLILLVDIASLACDILNLLQPGGFLKLSWATILNPHALERAFESLASKRELLHLHITSTHHQISVGIGRAVVGIHENLMNTSKKRQAALPASSQNSSKANMSDGVSISDKQKQIDASNSKVSGFQAQGEGWQPGELDTRINTSGSVVEGVQLTGNKGGTYPQDFFSRCLEKIGKSTGTNSG